MERKTENDLSSVSEHVHAVLAPLRMCLQVERRRLTMVQLNITAAFSKGEKLVSGTCTQDYCIKQQVCTGNGSIELKVMQFGQRNTCSNPL